MTPAPARRRVLVVSDATAYGLAAVERAADLALRIDAELSGLFMENVTLLRLALLPFVQETGLTSGRRWPLETQALEAAFRRDARRVERMLAEIAGRRGIAWSFSVRRGRPVHDALALAAGVEAVLFGREPLTADVAPRRARGGGAWLMLLAGADAGHRAALERALAVATGVCRELLVLVSGAAADLDRLRPADLPPGAPAVTLRAVAAEAGAVLEAVRRGAPELLILEGAMPGLTPEDTLERVLAQAPCPVLVMGERSADERRAEHGGPDDAV